MNNTIIIFGGDGYIGWPLAMKLAVKHPDHKIIIVDNEWRRNVVTASGYQSLIPISSPRQRLDSFEAVHGLSNILYLKGEIESDITENLIKNEKPHTIYHLAHQPSGPYSMKGMEEAIFTLKNNEGGNMRLMWAVMQHSPKTHIVKLGSIGQFAHIGFDIPEGYYLPEYNQQKAKKPSLFHREAEDIYHISKMNDTNYILMACRKWGLRITDVMQSTVFGVWTAEMQDVPELFSRFDYDDVFGTVLNRFITQVVSHHPMTIYGTGHQRTGLMALNDTVSSLANFTVNPAHEGEHRVINHVSEKHFSINEIAIAIGEVAQKNGYPAQISREFDPRVETPESKMEYDIETNYLDRTLEKSCFNEEVEATFNMAVRYKDRILTQKFQPGIHWSPSKRRFTDPERSSIGTGENSDKENNEAYWEHFRSERFPAFRINLNPGTLGTTPAAVWNARHHALKEAELYAYPLGAYQAYHQQMDRITALCNDIWPVKGYEVCVTHSITQEMTLLSLALLRALPKQPKSHYTIVTSTHEHYGGMGSFEQLPEFKVHYLTDATIADAQQLKRSLTDLQPDICFLSHVYFDTGILCDIKAVCTTVRSTVPDCKIIVDAAQSVGLYPLPQGDADAIVCSLHKWLFGPQGSGLLWIKNSFKEWLDAPVQFDPNPVKTEFMSADRNKGGLDFSQYSAIAAALQLYKDAGLNAVYDRSCTLARIMKEKLSAILNKRGIKFEFLNAVESPVLAVGFATYDPYPLYQYLNQHGIHIKCIKDHKIDGRVLHILRIGLPYYETVDRILFVLGEIEFYITQASMAGSATA